MSNKERLTQNNGKISELIDLLKTKDVPSGSDEEQPNEDLTWAKSVCENDVQEGFTYKVLQMISDGYVYTDIVVPSGGAVKTSDGGYYTANAKHTWNDENARQGQADIHKGQKLRWLIYYYTSEAPSITLLNDCMYVCFDGVKFGKVFRDKRMLEYYDTINGANLNAGITDLNGMFYYCYSLQSVNLGDTSHVTDMSTMFFYCTSLRSVNLPNTSNVTTMNSMFYYCYSLQSVILGDTSRVTDMSGMFGYCTSLQSVNLPNTSKVTNTSNMFRNSPSLQSVILGDTSKVTNAQYMFYYCSGLQTVILGDISSVTNTSNMFTSCSYLEFIEMENIPISFIISSSTKFSQATLENLIDNLIDLTGKTAQTFTMGSTNLAKVSQAKKDLATSKNWTLE